MRDRTQRNMAGRGECFWAWLSGAFPQEGAKVPFLPTLSDLHQTENRDVSWLNLPFVHTLCAQRPMCSVKQPFEWLTERGLPLKGFSLRFCLGLSITIMPSWDRERGLKESAVLFRCRHPLLTPSSCHSLCFSPLVLLISLLFLWNLSPSWGVKKDLHTHTHKA